MTAAQRRQDAGSGVPGWIAANIYWGRIKALWRIASSALGRFSRQDGDALSGYIAYSTFLSIFPFAIFATALIGATLGRMESDRLMDALFGMAPPHIAQTLAPVLKGITAGVRDGVLTISAVGGLWVASNAVEAIRVAFDRAYGVRRPRGYVRRRLRALGFVVLAAATFALLGFLIIAAPLALALIEKYSGFSAPFGVGALRYLIGVAILALFLFQINLLLPSQRPPRRRLWPGIWVSVALWTAGAGGFSVYLSYAPSYTITYGAFAGVIVTLLFFYLTGAAIILGAQVNAVLMAFRRPTARDSEASG
ncbi:MAG: hypothetical protein COW75_00040 [Rhodobacterales bacterium CG18_big_fil_WC_8_21_14_2_50_71_9]|nr:MAG: hypothetical protein COW75_00040 [Rhodobacterales bacterium CG18_big_fil_WC_8_21_14_2_50_71_9]